MREEEEGGDRPLVPGTRHLLTSWQPSLAPLQVQWAWPQPELMADVSLLEIPLPSDQGAQNKASHRRRKLPAWPWLWREGSDFNHTAGEIIGWARQRGSEGRSSCVEGLVRELFSPDPRACRQLGDSPAGGGEGLRMVLVRALSHL